MSNRQKGRRARKKGHDFERTIAKALRAIFPKAMRHLEYQHGEANGIDIANTGPFKIQCKKFQKYAPLTAIEEVQCDEFMGEIPVLVTAGDNKRPLACLPLEDFISLVKRAGVGGFGE